MNAHQKLAIKALSQMRSDDVIRARKAFRGMTPEEMQQQHGESGMTRSEVLESYETATARIDEAILWVAAQKS